MYLQEDSPKGVEMRKKVRDMLLSGEESNFQLALQLIQNGGMHSDFLAPLWTYHRMVKNPWENEEAMETIKNLLFLILKEEQQTVFVDTEHEYLYWADLLIELNDNPVINSIIKDLAICGLTLMKQGGKFCYDNDVLPKKTIFKLMIQGNGLLDLSEFNLQEIPPEIANLPIKELNFRDNPLEREPSSVWANTQLERVWFYSDTHPRLIRRYAKCFPNAVDESYYSMGETLAIQASELQHNNKMQEAAGKSNHSLHFLRRVSKKSRDKDYYHTRAHICNTAGRYQIAKICHDHIIESGEDYSDCLYNMACNQARLGNKAKTLEYLEGDIQYKINKNDYDESDKDYILNDNDFDIYWNDLDFLALLERYPPLNQE